MGCAGLTRGRSRRGLGARSGSRGVAGARQNRRGERWEGRGDDGWRGVGVAGRARAGCCTKPRIMQVHDWTGAAGGP